GAAPPSGQEPDIQAELRLSHRCRTTVAFDDERRTLAWWANEIGIGRRVVQGMGSRLTVFGGKRNGSRDGNEAGVDGLLQAASEHLARASRRVQANDGRRLG